MIICKMNKDSRVSDIEIHEGLFQDNQIIFGRILKRNTLSIGRFNNLKLEGYGKKVLPNFVIQEGIYKNGITQNESNDEVHVKERWLRHFSDDFSID
jgi:hypothetical protein